MKLEELTFPMTEDEMFSFQESLLGDTLGDNLKSAIAAWVPAFNDAFEDGKEGIDQSGDLAYIDRMTEEHAGNAFIHRFLTVSRRWMTYAWGRGKAMREGATA